MKQKTKLAFEHLAKEMETVCIEEQKHYLGGTDGTGYSSSGWYGYLTSIFGEPTRMDDGSLFWGKKPGDPGYDSNYLYNDANYGGSWAGNEVVVTNTKKNTPSTGSNNPIGDAFDSIHGPNGSIANGSTGSSGKTNSTGSTGSYNDGSTGAPNPYYDLYASYGLPTGWHFPMNVLIPPPPAYPDWYRNPAGPSNSAVPNNNDFIDVSIANMINAEIDSTKKVEALLQNPSALSPADKEYIKGALTDLILDKAGRSANPYLSYLSSYTGIALTFVDFQKAMTNPNQNTLPLPVVGPLASMITMDRENKFIQDSYLYAAGEGYSEITRFMNSSLGDRSGLTGVYVTQENMQRIMNEGLNLNKIPTSTFYGNNYPNNPIDDNGNKLDYLILFDKDLPKKNNGEVSEVNIFKIP